MVERPVRKPLTNFLAHLGVVEFLVLSVLSPDVALESKMSLK